MKKSGVLLITLLLAIFVSPISITYSLPSNCLIGVWNNFDFSLPAEDWAQAAYRVGGEGGIVDLVVAQAWEHVVALPYPFQDTGDFHSSSDTDSAEAYLQAFDSKGLRVILSIQPLAADITQLIDMLLSRYGNHSSILGVNVDLEWKQSGTPNHATNEERDAWLDTIKTYNSNFKLFLTYFEDYTYFPEDAPDMVILFDGEGEIQTNLLNEYQQLANHFSSVGIYTGYPSSVPPTASIERILTTVPKTAYVLHTYDVFSDRQIVIFEMDDVQVDWLESTSIDLLNLHIDKRVPVLCGVIPNNFDNPNVGGGYLPLYIRNLNKNYTDLIEIGQHGYTHNATERLGNQSYSEQMVVINKGLEILESMGIKPATFSAAYGDQDNTTIQVVQDLGFKIIIDLYQNLASNETSVILGGAGSHWTFLMENGTVLKSAKQLMEEIDQQTDDEPFLLLYNVFDMRNASTFQAFSQLLDTLTSSGKYLFLTPRQYREQVMDEYIQTTILQPPSRKILIFEMDDVQVDWLGSDAVRVFERHMDESIPLVVGVIPHGFDTPITGQQSALGNYLKDLDTNYCDLFNIGQHGYTHDDSEILRGKTYEEQKEIIQNGRTLLASLGITPSIFIPPYGSADNTTVTVAEDLNFNILVTVTQDLESDNLLIIDSWVSLTHRVENRTTLKSAEQLMEEIDQQTEEAVIILYQIHDFQVDRNDKLDELSDIFDALKNSDKYTFLTAQQYFDSLDYPQANPNAQPKYFALWDWVPYLLVGVLASVTVISVIRKVKAQCA
jgi:peptidoglycan/xylan/chitin deacetylase (PgdA/CDA1 family)